MSIFSGLSLENLKIAIEAAKHSPKALAALAIIAVVAVAAIGFAGHMIAHHVGGFYARIEEEDERARREEEKEEQEEKEQNQKYHTCEFRYGKYQRTISFDQPIKANEGRAEYKNGVLKIQVPKQHIEEMNTRHLKIE